MRSPAPPVEFVVQMFLSLLAVTLSRVAGPPRGLNAHAQPRALFGNASRLVFMDGPRSPEELEARMGELNEAAVTIQSRADEEGRPVTEEEAAEIDQIMAEFDETEQERDRRRRMVANGERLAQSAGRKVISDPDPDANGGSNAATFRAGARVEPSGDKNKWGFNYFGEFAAAVKKACAPGGGQVDNKLIVHSAPSTYGTEGVGEDGGFAVPPEFRREIMEKVEAEDQLLSRTDQLESSSNAIVVPVDETSPWDASGVQAYWEGEADQMQQTKPKLRENSVRLNKLTALVPVSNELLEDAPAMDGYLRRKAPQKLNFKINRAIIAGNGVGQPMGLLNAPALVTVSKETSQDADTILYDNIVKMFSRMYSQCWNRSVWLANQDILPQLMTLGFPTSATSVPVWLPPSGLADAPFGRLLGRPLVFTEAAETLGDKGDLMLVDLSQYMTALKLGGIRAETSMHLYFDYDMMAFRFILRVAGSPWWSQSIAPRSASGNTLSCFVALAERS